ncbi:unnamed protein product [Hydatigera taeniaeformis]|uniref:Rho-GAP domain-containing protein n=1 Tax=Hydatigena taeniaeformis TaxID=6205 RepID=A0A0R3X7L8_HYDTA|nr:unnamed protein product [Hydatigera taeniaeformis]
MEKFLRQFNTSPPNIAPVVKRKANGFSSVVPGCFGVRLDELCARDGQNVPLIIIQLCAFLRALGGLCAEGVFRINGNSRVIENLRIAADSSASTGDGDIFLAHLERYGDIHSVASLIKLFLRELPVGLVPEPHTKALLEEYSIHAEDSLVVIERIIRSLPPPNFRLLEYLCCFLRQVTHYQSQNKMNSTSIGIIFGPNVFRVPSEFDGLTNQSLINHVMGVLVERSDVLFTRKPILELPLRSPAPKAYRGVNMNPIRLASCEEVVPGEPMEGHQHLSVNYCPRSHRIDTDRSPFLDIESARETFASEMELWRHGRDHQPKMSPSDIESQSVVLNPVADVAEQLSTTLQSCLRNCVRQHALSLSHRCSQHSPANSSTTASPQWLGDLVGGSAASLLSPLCTCSHPTQTSPTLPTDSNTSLTNGVVHSGGTGLRKLRNSTSPPQLQPQTEFRAFSQVGTGQEPNGFANDLPIARSGDLGTEEVLRFQDVEFSGSTKHSNPWRTLESAAIGIAFLILGRWPVAEETTAVAKGQRKEDGGHFRPRLATYDSMRFKTPLYPLEGSRRVECIMKAYNEIVQRLAEKRRISNRPERLIDMTLQELETEKLVIQRALLAFETAYGRPRERNDRVVMRPVYDRYRCVKRLLAGASSHHCSSPNTPARAFAPPDMLDSAIGAVDTTVPLATPHSQYSEHVSSLPLLTDPPHVGTTDVVTLTHQGLSIDTSDDPQFHNSAASSRCTSLVTSTNARTPDEWCKCFKRFPIFIPPPLFGFFIRYGHVRIAEIGSIGVSTRPSGQQAQSPLRYSEVEQAGEREHNTGVMLLKGEEVGAFEVRVQEIEEESEELTVGRRTPFSRSPLLSLSPSPPPSPPTSQHPRRRQQRCKHGEAPISTALQRTQWSIDGRENAHSQLLSQPPRQLTLFPTTFSSHRHHVQHHQHQIRLPVGGDPESGKPLEQAIADCVAKYETFTLSELQIELSSVRDSKRTLQKFLKEFEHNFERKHGRRVEVEDRQPLNPEYLHYKMLKARLTSLERLLEARSTKV